MEYCYPKKLNNDLSSFLPYFSSYVTGRFYNEDQKIYEVIDMKRTFLSSGAELKVETTLGYVLPVSWVFGYYAAFNQPQGVEGSFALSLQITGF